jgi:hypothetical protein
MKVVGRIIARGNKIAGIFMPMGDGPKLDGIYNVVEIMGELQIQRVGDPMMRREQFTGIDLEGLMNHRPMSMMTEQEYQRLK